MGFEKSEKSAKLSKESNGVKNQAFIDDEVKFPKLDSSKDGVESESDETKNNKEPEEVKDKSSFFALFKYSRASDRCLYFIGIIAAVITGLTTPANSFIFGNLSDSMVIYGLQVNINPATADHQLFLDAVQQFALYNTLIGVVMLVCTYLAVTCFNYAAQSQIFIIRNKFFRSVLHQDISWYDVNQSGEFASRMNEDLSKMEEGLGEKVVMFITFFSAFVGAIVLAFVKGWLLALVCLSSLPVTMISLGIVSVVTSRLSKQELDVYAKAGNIAEEAFTAVRTVKAFEGQELECEKYESQLVHARELNTKRGFFSAFGFGLLWFFIYASYALAFWYGVKLILNEIGKPADQIVYTPGTMITVFFSVMMGSMNIGMASPYIEAFGIAKGASVKVFKLIEQIPTINPLNFRGKVTDEAFKLIEFRNIHFAYPTRKEVQVLNGINIKIQKGETVALVGSSGCGKSTCIQLLQRFYDPDAGEILFNGDDLKELNVEWVRSKIGTVGQEPILFGTTIAENIRYGRENATMKEIEEAAKQAYAHAFIKKLPLGYDTLVGERGAQLSGGQKQRIAIARALIRNPEILLLDEATSALDTASEAKVQAVLEKASQGRTTIIVAHRLTTIRRADKIIVLNKGNVVESGTHSELMELRQEYYNLVTTQMGDLNDLNRPESATQDKKAFEFKDNTNDDNHSILEADEDVKQTELSLDEEEEDEGDVSLLRIAKMNSPEWPQILIGCVTSVIMGAAFPLFAVLFGDILGALSGEEPDAVRAKANKFSMYFAITGVVVGLATFLTIYTFTIAGEKLTERLRGLAFRAMLRQELGWFDDKSNGTGSLCARLSGDASAVQGATGQRIGTIIQSLTTLVLSVVLSMYYQWKLGLVALAFTPFILVATFLQRKVMAQENSGTSKSMEKCTKLAVEVVSNIRTVVSLGRENMFHTQYVDMLEPSVKLAKRNTHYRGVVYGLARSIMFFAYATCMYYGGQLVVNTGLFYGDVFKVSQAMIMGTMSIANALAFAPNFQKGVQAAKYMFTLFNRKPKIQDPPSYQATQNESWKCNGNVSFQEVNFFYPTRPSVQVLQELNMSIYEGQTVALVGPSGCGKSTCIQLLQRFYDPYRGSVAVDKSDVKSVSQKTLRKQLGIVSQEPALFDRTIAENIAYGDNSRQVGQDEIIDAAKKANIHNFITSLPLGYETRLGEKGTQLSGGQKQRVAIARALLRNPKILLLDEATSALDAESERVVQEALETAMVGRTSLTIAHRLSTIIDSDVILVFDAGRIVEKGTHKELLAMRGVYYNLYRLQVGTN